MYVTNRIHYAGGGSLQATYSAFHGCAGGGEAGASIVRHSLQLPLRDTPSRQFYSSHTPSSLFTLTPCMEGQTPEACRDTDTYGRPSPWKFVRHNDCQSLKLWLKENEECVDDLSDSNGGLSLLHLAAAKGRLEICKLLVKHHADVNTLSKKGCRAIHLASRHGQVDTVKFLVEEAGASTEDLTSDGWYPLHEAASNNKPQTIIYLHHMGAKLDCVTVEKYETPLMLACKNGHVGSVRALVELGADVNSANRSGYTPLMAACSLGHVGVVQLLCDRGADLGLKSKKGSNCVHLAARSGNLQLLGVLEQHGAPLFEKTLDDWTCLHEAADTDQPDAIAFFLGRGLNVNSRTETGNTALHIAVTKLHAAASRALCRRRANPPPNPKLRNKAGQSVLDLLETSALPEDVKEAIRSLETAPKSGKTRNNVVFSENVRKREIEPRVSSKDKPPEDVPDWPGVADVFLSYSWANSQLVEQLYQMLVKKGYRVWLDRYRIKPGDKLQSKLNEGVTNCKIFLPCLSQDYLRSDNCNNEFHLAKCRSKQIVPLILDPSVVAIWPPACDLAPLLAPLVYLPICDPTSGTLSREEVRKLCDKIDGLENDHSIPNIIN